MTESHVAPGQALGYIYQFDRATFQLLNSDVSVVEVGIEDIDDVSLHRADGTQIREQDKSVTDNYNPLTDRSVALWKTLHIWANDILIDPNILKTTEFHIVTNGKVSENCLAAQIHTAKTPEQTSKIAQQIHTMANSLRDNLADYGSTINNLSNELLMEFLSRIYVFDSVSSSFGGSLDDIQSLRYFTPEIRVQIFDLASGWIKRQIRNSVETNIRPKIVKVEFDKEITSLIRKFQIAPLLLMSQPQPSDTVINEHKARGFVQQLDWIESDELTIRNAVIHYIYAKNTRTNWTDAALVSETSLSAYEEDLVTRWNLARQRVSRRNISSQVSQGQECMDETLKEETYVDNEHMPKQFTCGSFHALADFKEEIPPRIGWHPDFLNLSNRG